jgi:hypothetical protein
VIGDVSYCSTITSGWSGRGSNPQPQHREAREAATPRRAAVGGVRVRYNAKCGIPGGEDTDEVNRAHWQRLAEDRVVDAQILLGSQRWNAAYHLAGYAVECGLKACILARVDKDSGVIYGAKDFLNNCWIHDLEKLIENAGLKVDRDALCRTNIAFQGYWAVTKDWTEKSRYDVRTESQAKELFEAISHEPDGVLSWIRKHW